MLVDLKQYQIHYNDLKARYAKDIASVLVVVIFKGFLQFWCESTDADKFIHEDIGIAAYLLVGSSKMYICKCLWRDNADEEPNFVDIGCGNGLLVYILVSEGVCILIVYGFASIKVLEQTFTKGKSGVDIRPSLAETYS